MKTIYVVGYDGYANLITEDKKEAVRFCEKQKAKYNALDWGVRTIKEAIEHAYTSGYDEGSYNAQAYD